MLLTPTTSKVLSYLELKADASMAEAAKALGMKESTVRYQLDKLIDEEIFVGHRAYLNYSRMGLSSFFFMMSVGNQNEEKRREFELWLTEEPEVSWFCELGGDYDYGVSLLAPNPHSTLVFLDKLAEFYPGLLRSKSFCMSISVTTYPRDYLAKSPSPIATLYRGGTEVVPLDEVDRKVLGVLSKLSESSNRERALQSGVPVSTFFRRMESLRKKGVISGCQYVVNAERLGIQSYRLQLQTPTRSASVSSKLRALAGESSRIRKLVECIGSWDYELEVDIGQVGELRQIKESVFRELGAEVSQIRVVPLLKNIACQPIF
jgi:DNA-binding Lrp family transcriptional regulator